MNSSRLLLPLLGVSLAGALLAWSLLNGESEGPPQTLADFSVEQRPQSDRLLFDYARVLRHYEEAAHEYLGRLDRRFHLEALIVSVPALPAGHTIETLAADLANKWRIGAEHDGRGLLLLLADRTKQVKLEVSYALEGLFTDAFSGYIEDLQLAPYYRAGDLGTGLIAVMEMLEERAQIKGQEGYTPDSVAQADALLLAGGAGAGRALEGYRGQAAETTRPTGRGRGARTPEAAWRAMLAKWAGEGAHLDVDVYTQMTRMAMGDADRPDPRTLKWLDHWRNAEYQVLRRGNHAVIWFGAIDGWENSPFLFCDPGDGWRFDIVWQRRLVVMAEHPKWQVMQGPFPYVGLMHKAWQSTAKDLPLSARDIYRCAEDAAIAARMAELRQALEHNPQDAAATLELMRLHVITDQRPNLVHPLIDKARQLAPQSPMPFKYAAIYKVNSSFQYRSALKEVRRYIALRPDDPFGYDMKGFILFRLGRYQDAIDALQEAVERDPEDGYAYALMARNYAMLARKAHWPKKDRYRDKARAMQQEAAGVALPDSVRLARLDHWLNKML